jgi:hypothetical protein
MTTIATTGELALNAETVEALSGALDEICRILKLDDNASAREIVAIRLLGLARQGKRDPVKLRELVLAEANSGSRC